MIAQASAPDPRVINAATESWAVNASKVGLTAAPVQIAGPTLLLLTVGQSIVSNFNGPANITLTDANVQMMHPFDGSLWVAKDPLIGNDSTQSCPVAYLARDIRANNVFPRVIVMAAGVGATAIAQHAPGGRYQNHALNMVCRAKGYGWLADPRVKQAMIWSQGISDAIAPAGSVTSAQYTAQLQTIRLAVERQGWTGPTWVEKQTATSLATPNAANVRAGQVAAINGSTLRDGFDFDTLVAGDKHDGTHLNAIGCQKWADAYRAIITAWNAT